MKIGYKSFVINTYIKDNFYHFKWAEDMYRNLSVRHLHNSIWPNYPLILSKYTDVCHNHCIYPCDIILDFRHTSAHSTVSLYRQ